MKKVISGALMMSAAMLSASGLRAQTETTVDWLHLQSVPEYVELMEQAAREFEEQTPGVTVNLQFLENEAYKAKLTTLLQSDAAPDIFYSWGGGILSDQQKAGVLRSIDDVSSPEIREMIGSAGINAFTRDGKLYGFAENVSHVGFWVNKALVAEAGVELEDLATWDGLLTAVKKMKDAGITPIAMGGQDKWPAHFYWSYLVVRLAGQEAFDEARLGKGDGFAGAPFVEAGEKFNELVALEPFQDGYLAATYGNAAGHFGDGKAALHLMGNWDLGVARSESASGEGLSDDEMAFIPFPSVEGGDGMPNDTLGGINGWIFHKDAPDAAVDFAAFVATPEVQQRFAAVGAYVPIVAGGADTMENQFLRDAASAVSNANWHAIFFDQELGADVGGVVNDISVELADGSISPEDAAELVKEAVDDSL